MVKAAQDRQRTIVSDPQLARFDIVFPVQVAIFAVQYQGVRGLIDTVMSVADELAAVGAENVEVRGRKLNTSAALAQGQPTSARTSAPQRAAHLQFDLNRLA